MVLCLKPSKRRERREERKEGLAAPGKAREFKPSNQYRKAVSTVIYIQSFFSLPPEAGRKGKAFSIANSAPNRVKVDGTIECLVPPWSLVRDFKAQKIDWEAYTDYYREYLRENWRPVKAWLQSLNDVEDVYLCCWERTPDYCHRSLVAKMIRLNRPDLEVELK